MHQFPQKICSSTTSNWW